MSLMNKKLLCLQDYEDEAKNKLSKAILAYFAGGGMHEVTLKENIEAMNRWYIRPRYFRDVSQRDLTTEVLGHRVSVPFGVAPAASQKLAHPDGEIGNSKAAANVNTIFTLSTFSNISIEDVASSSPTGLKFLQFYLFKDKWFTEITSSLIGRAEAAGFRALVLTVDHPVNSIRLSCDRSNFNAVETYRYANFTDTLVKKLETDTNRTADIFDSSATWESVKKVKRLTKLPIVLKGVLTAEDARLGLQAGASAIWVSNHGGRQLDHVPPTLEALTDVVREVGDECEVYVDGGFRTGTDIFKALAIGARMVFLGRPLLWGLACGGEEGANHVLSLLKKELDITMALAGCPTIKDISRDMIVRKDFYPRI